jgi:hypothetical protein
LISGSCFGQLGKTAAPRNTEKREKDHKAESILTARVSGLRQTETKKEAKILRRLLQERPAKNKPRKTKEILQDSPCLILTT